MQKTAESMLGCITPVCFAPVALSKVIQVASVNGRGSRRKFYCHAICGIDRLKAIGKERYAPSHICVSVSWKTSACAPSAQGYWIAHLDAHRVYSRRLLHGRSEQRARECRVQCSLRPHIARR